MKAQEKLNKLRVQYNQILNLLIFHQGEKAFLSRKINSRAFIGKF